MAAAPTDNDDDGVVDSAEISADVKKLACFVCTYGNTTVTIEGHPDSRGAANHNQMLSYKRADAVREAMIAEGIDAGRIEAIGYGETKPVADNDTR